VIISLAKFMDINCSSQHKISMAKLFFQIYRYGYIDNKNSQDLQNILLQESVTQEEKIYVDRILYAVRQGWVRIVKNF